MSTRPNQEQTQKRSQEVLRDVRAAAYQAPDWIKQHVSRVWNEYYEKPDVKAELTPARR